MALSKRGELEWDYVTGFMSDLNELIHKKKHLEQFLAQEKY